MAKGDRSEGRGHLAFARLTFTLCPLGHLLLLHNRAGRHWWCWAALPLHLLGACDPPAADWLCMCSDDAVLCYVSVRHERSCSKRSLHWPGRAQRVWYLGSASVKLRS